MMNARIRSNESFLQKLTASSPLRRFYNFLFSPHNTLSPEENSQFGEAEREAFECLSKTDSQRFKSEVLVNRRILRAVDADVQESIRNFERRAEDDIRKAGEKFRRRLADTVRKRRRNSADIDRRRQRRHSTNGLEKI